MTDAISVSGLVKTFGRTRALDGLDLTVHAGEVHGFLGPNGSGKSTTIRVLLGLLRADAGEVRLLGGDPWRDVASLHRRLAYVPGDVTLWPNLTGGEVIDLLGRLRGGQNAMRRAELLEMFELGGRYPAIVGSAAQVADELQAWIEETGVDGFNLSRTVVPESYEDFIDLVVPELQNRGLYKTAYADGTLRHKLFGQGDQLPARHAAASFRQHTAEAV